MLLRIELPSGNKVWSLKLAPPRPTNRRFSSTLLSLHVVQVETIKCSLALGRPRYEQCRYIVQDKQCDMNTLCSMNNKIYSAGTSTNNVNSETLYTE